MRRFHGMFALFTLTILLAVVIIRHTAGQSETARAENNADRPNFSGKVVLLRVDKSTSVESKSESLVIKSPHILTLGNRHFIHGQPYVKKDDPTENWFAEGEIGCAWETVREYWVFTPDAYDKYEEKRQNKEDADE